MNHNPSNPNEGQKAPAGNPDPATLHTTDPQEHMHGPVSDLMHGIEGEGEKSDSEDPVAAREQQDKARESSSD
jgi:hypothetical protein